MEPVESLEIEIDGDQDEKTDDENEKTDDVDEELSEGNQAVEETEETLEDRIARLKVELANAEVELEEQTPVAEAFDDVNIPSGALVVISSERAEGSGFVGKMRGKTFLITNIHVLGAARGASIQTLDGVDLTLPSYAFVSQQRDVALVPLGWADDALPVSESLNNDEVKIGNAVTVMGNSDGTRVAIQLKGDVEGIGPNEIQVSAKFVPGNSGSPIVHNDSSKVVAIASYLRDLSAKNKWTEDTELADIRRFGYRLDGAIEWEKIQLHKLFDQAEAFHRFEDRTAVIGRLAYMMEFESKIVTGYRSHGSLGYLLEYFEDDFQWHRGKSSAHNRQLLKRFVEGLLTELQSDKENTKKALKIEFYQRRLREVQDVRDKVVQNLTRFRNLELD